MSDEILEFPKLHKRGTGGEIRVWWMQLGEAKHRVCSGVLNGKITESGWTMCDAKNIGKKNALTAHQQAMAEIDANYAKKRSRGNFDDEANVDNVEFTKPMLAHKYEAGLKFPVLSQPKLDGIRCIARSDGLWTRTGKRITAVPHISAALKAQFDENPDLILDGELYNHDLKADFNSIVSMVRKEAPNALELELAAKMIQYHVYDQITDEDVGVRLTSLVKAGSPSSIRLVQTDVANNQDELDRLYGEYIEAEYEGQMVRKFGSKYENKRSKNLLKRKEFDSAEFKVAAVLEGNGNWLGHVKKFKVIVDSAGKTQGAGVRGQKASLKALMTADVPDWATVRFFGLTPDGMMRFPVVTDWGYGKRAD